LEESQVLDLDGRPVDPFAVTNAAATVLLFVGRECPISNRYAPELRRLHEKFSPRGVRFWFVYPDADTTAEEIRRHVREFNLPGDAVRDPRHILVGKSRTTVTPEGAVFTGAGRLAYHGRIDDRVVDFGKERPAPSQRDLHDAIEAVLAGKKPRNASTRAVGCHIPDVR
jgi:MoxR-like ATPase